MVIPIIGMLITQDTLFRPGVFAPPRGIAIAASGITVDGNSALLIGTGRDGIALKNPRI